MRIPQYQSFGDMWQSCLHPHRAGFSDGAFPIVAADDANEAELDAIIHLPEWPGSLDILVHARERFTLSRPHKILASNIKVTYYRVRGAEKLAEPLSTVHYDYDRVVRPGHPVYHFQCCTDPVSSGRLPPSWRYTLDVKPARSSFPFRVPTPHMGLCCVLIGLVADHLPSDQFRGLIEAIEKKGWIPPQPDHSELWSLGGGGKNARALHNWQWYFWPD